MTTKISYTINEACAALGIGRTNMYGLIGSGDLKTFKLGGRTLIRAGELHKLVERAQQDN